MVTCPNCGKNTPHGKFCEHCGAQLITLQQPAQLYQNSPVNKEPIVVSEFPNYTRSFKFSKLFYLVIIVDLILTVLFTWILGGELFSGKYPHSNLINSYCVIFLSINFVLDLVYIHTIWKPANRIDIRYCWIKGIAGLLGIFTIIPGLYFLIIAILMHRAYKK